MPIGYLSRISHTFIYELNPFRPREESDWIVRSPCFLPSLNASEVSTLSLLKPVHLLGRELGAYHLCGCLFACRGLCAYTYRRTCALKTPVVRLTGGPI